nr:hypothetical protein [Candidatus Freyarchaeota archaeon]
MNKLKISSFKMFEKAPYELPDPKALMEAQMLGFRELEKLFGPVFLTRFIKHALQFIAQKIGETPPEDIKTLDQLAEYLLSKTNKYPLPNCAFYYAQIKTENELQGRTGAAYRVGEMGFHRRYVKSPNGEERTVDLDDIMSKLCQFAIGMKLRPKELGYKTNEDGSLDLILPNCFYKEVCRQAFDENLLKRLDGRMQCAMGSTLCQYFKLVTGYEWDYDCLEFDKPHCITRCFMF